MGRGGKPSRNQRVYFMAFIPPFQDIVPAVDEYRSRIRKINEKRDLLVSQMERMDSTNRHTHEIFDDLEQNVKILRQLNREFTSNDDGQVTNGEAESKKTIVSG